MLKKILLLSLVLISFAFVLRYILHKTLSSDSAEGVGSDSQTIKARELEEIKNNIDYCLVNIGEKYSKLDEKQAGGFWPQKDLGVLTYALLAQKYSQYGDSGKAADYYYLNWLHYNTPQTEGTRWPYPDGEHDDFFASAMYRWEAAGKYKEIVEHYEEYVAYSYSPLKTGSVIDQLKAMKEAMPSWDAEMRGSYESTIQNLNKYKILAETGKPNLLVPAVQNHEWFYSDKPEEVLRALDYYCKYKVRFMLEKALKHKDAVVAAKARKYLDSLAKENANNEAKK